MTKDELADLCRADSLRLMCGELTPSELRLAQAVARGICAKIGHSPSEAVQPSHNKALEDHNAGIAALQRDAARYEARRWQAYSLGRNGGDSIEYAAFVAQYDAVSDAAMRQSAGEGKE